MCLSNGPPFQSAHYGDIFLRSLYKWDDCPHLVVESCCKVVPLVWVLVKWSPLCDCLSSGPSCLLACLVVPFVWLPIKCLSSRHVVPLVLSSRQVVPLVWVLAKLSPLSECLPCDLPCQSACQVVQLVSVLVKWFPLSECSSLYGDVYCNDLFVNRMIVLTL